MPLPRRGQITMAEIRAELGYSGQVAMSYVDVRKLLGKNSGEEFAMGSLRGAALITVGSASTKSGTVYGYSSFSAFGSMSSYNYGDHTIGAFTWDGADYLTVTLNTGNVWSGYIKNVSVGSGALIARTSYGADSANSRYYFQMPYGLPTSGEHGIRLYG